MFCRIRTLPSALGSRLGLGALAFLQLHHHVFMSCPFLYLARGPGSTAGSSVGALGFHFWELRLNRAGGAHLSCSWVVHILLCVRLWTDVIISSPSSLEDKGVKDGKNCLFETQSFDVTPRPQPTRPPVGAPRFLHLKFSVQCQLRKWLGI